MNRIKVTATLAALMITGLANAQVTAPLYKTNAGVNQSAQGMMCLTSAGTECSFGGGGGGAATIADGADVAQGSRADAAWVSGSGTSIAINKAMVAAQLAINALLPASIGTKTAAGSLSVVLASDGTLPLPTGAATSARQDTGNTSLGSIDTKLSSTATAARQDTGNSSLSSIDGKLTGPLVVVGNVADGATDSGASVKTGAVYQTAGTLGAVTVGTRVAAQADSRGNWRVATAMNNATPVDTIGVVGLPYSISSNSTSSGAPTGSGGFVWNTTTSMWNMWRGTTSGGFVIQKGGDNIATGQISVTTSATLIAAARTGRQKITVSVGAANTCAFGNTGVTTTTGFAVAPTVGASLTLDTAAALYAICSATTTISYVEQY